MAAIVLVGGESRRLGQDKAFLTVRGRPLIQGLVERLQELFSPRHILLVAPPARLERFTWLRLPLVADRYVGRGPLAGLHAGLLAAGPGFHFVISCDQPFFEPRFIRYLLQRARDAGESAPDAVVPWANGHWQLLHAVYHARCAAVAASLLEAGQNRLGLLLAHIQWLRVDEEEIAPFGAPARLFFNLNTPEDRLTLAEWEPD